MISKMRFELGILLVGAAAGALLQGSPSIACQCGTIPPPTQAAEQSVAVLAGTVVSIRETRVRIQMGDRNESVRASRVVVKPQRVWKGSAEADSISLLTGLTNCEYRFEGGATYLFYVEKSSQPGEITATICKPTKRYRDAAADLKELGPGELVRKR
jgi:hypothetical protein